MATATPPKIMVLEPGNHHVELEIGGSSTPAALKAGMLRLGFSSVFVDIASRQETIGGSVQFLGKLPTRVSLRDTALVRWKSVRRLRVDLNAPLRFTLEPFELRPEQLYEVRFLSRPVRRKDAARYEKATDPEREVLRERLATAGWETTTLAVIRRDVRAPSRPDAELTLWFGVLRWTGPESFVTDCEPFSFEDMLPI